MSNLDVLLFGIFRELAGTARLQIELPLPTDAATLRRSLANRWPELAPALRASRVAIDGAYADDDTEVVVGSEVALIPPVSGGSGPQARIVHEAIDLPAVLASIADPKAGGNTLFVGTVRDHHEGRGVKYLVYEAYTCMAETELEKIVQRALTDFGLRRMTIVHRVGRLEIGDAAIAIGASADHREETLAAVRWAMNMVKHEVPIFKHEFYLDGSSAWVRCEHMAAGHVDHQTDHHGPASEGKLQ